MNKKVMLGMSGGVDSSVAAAVLIEQGYDIIGVNLKLWDAIGLDETTKMKSCCSIDDVEDARNIAFALDFPFYVLNMKKQFKEKVVDHFVQLYLKGETPNPCTDCNRYLKFDAMLNKALSLDFDYIATGHYAVNEYDQLSGRYLLKKSADQSKDQSYVLYMLRQEQLRHILFPLGNYTKKKAREIAAEKNLRIHDKPDSQDICFVTGEKYSSFIKKYSDKEVLPGNFINSKGKILGKHKGIIYYTAGQRKRLGISADEPLYVVGINHKDNTVILGTKPETLTQKIFLRDMNYIQFEKPDKEFRAKVKVRYSDKETEAIIYPLEGSTAIVEFLKPKQFIAPGQSAVIYDGDIVTGGGIIYK